MPCLDYLFLGIFAILFATGTGIELYWITTQNWPDDFFTILLCCALTGLGALFLFFRELIAEPKTWRNHVMLVLWGVTLALPIVTVWSGNSYISSCIERAGPGTTLKACNLSGADLHSKDLSGADLTNANLNNTNLQHANLTMANLTNASLIGADLTNAIMQNVILDGTTLQDAKGLTDEVLASALGISKEELPLITSQKHIRLDSEDYIAEGLTKVCDVEEGIPATNAYASDASFHPVFTFVMESGPCSNPYLPNEGEPMALRFTELVGCVQVQKEIMETCYYSPHGLQFSGPNIFIRRVRNNVEYNLREAQTGKVVASQVFIGTDPQECPPVFPNVADKDWEQTRDNEGNNGYIITGGCVWPSLDPWLGNYMNLPTP